MVEGQGDPAAMAHLLTETDIVRAQDLPATFAEFQTEVEIDTVDEERLGKASYGFPSLEAHHVACRDGVGDVFSARCALGMLAS